MTESQFPAQRATKAQPEFKAEGFYLEHLSQFFYSCQKYPYSKLAFITLRDPRNRLNMNKVRKWCVKFSKTYCIASSPVGGTHFHLLAVTDKKLPFLRGSVHVHVQFLNSNSEPPQFEAPTMPLVFHPYINGKPGILLMDLCAEIRDHHNGLKSHPLQRLRACKAAVVAKTKKATHITNCINYIYSNFLENSTPEYYLNLYITA